MKKILLSLMLLFVFVGCTANTNNKENVNLDNKEKVTKTVLVQYEKVKKGDTVALLKTTMGDVKIKLFPKYAPKAVENFTTHAKNGYYDGLLFHRVIKDFMIQSGDPKGNGTGGESIWKENFEDEFSQNLFNFNGALSMANSGPNTNGSQFFIVTSKTIPDMWKQIIEQKDVTEGEIIQVYSYLYKDMLTLKNLAIIPIYKNNKNILDKYTEVGGAPWLDYKHTVFGQVYEGMDIVNKIQEVEVVEEDKPKEDVKINKIEIMTIK